MSRPPLRRAAVLALSALALPLLPVAPAAAQTAATPAVRDVREFACPPGQVRRPGVQPRFRDTAGSTFELEIDCLAGFEVTLGTGDGTTYAPSGTVTRAQMAQFLARVAQRAGLPLDTRDAGFRDIGFLPPAARDAINAIANLDVARGRSAGVYAPLDPVRRDQMASFLDRLQQRVQPAFTANRDYFSDDAGGAEASINRVAEAGIVQGVGGGRYEPARALTRQQMAGFLTRYLDVLVEAGKVAAAYVRDNEVLPVAPREAQRVLPGGVVDYSTTSLTGGVEYRVLLVDTRTLRRATSTPTVLFFADGDGDRVADTGTVSARLTQLNGAGLGTGGVTTAVGRPVDGRLTFRVTGGSPDDDVTPLVFPNTGRSTGLELARDLRAVEAFGAGGRVLVAPVDAQPGTSACVNGCLVTAVDRTTSSTTLDTDGNGRGDAVFRYVSGTDSFNVRSGGTTTPVPASEFAARLTRGDTLAVNPYKTGPSGSSTFFLTDTSLTAPTVTAAAGTGSAAGTATVSVVSSTSVVTFDRFVIERAPVTPPEGCGTPAAQAGSFTQVADLAAAEDADAAAAGFQYVDRPGTGCFRYRALGIVDEQRSNAGTSGNVAVTAPTAPDTVRPVTQSARVARDSGVTGTADFPDEIVLQFNEPVTVASDAFLQVRRTNGAFVTIRNQADALFRGSGTSTITINPAPGFNAGPYPLTITDAGRITDAAGNPYDVATSPDRVID